MTSQLAYLTLQHRLEALLTQLYPNSPVSASQANALFSHSIQLLPLLNNPLNIELLAHHILQSPAIWTSDSRPVRHYTTIVEGFRASLGWKLKDLEEEKGGISADEWIMAVCRGAIGNTPSWKHLMMFAGLRSAASEKVKRKTTGALEHAYARAFFSAIGDVTTDIAEAMLFSLALMKHSNLSIIDQLLATGKTDLLLTFLVDAMYSPTIGFFHDIPIVIVSLGRASDSLDLVQNLESHVLQPHVSHISSIISSTFPLIGDLAWLTRALDRILALTTYIREVFSSLPEAIAQSFISATSSLTAKTDILPILWEHLTRFLFATVMSLQGIITKVMHSPRLGPGNHHMNGSDTEYVTISSKVLECLRNLTFIGARLGYSTFDEWKFVYFASIDLLSSSPVQTRMFVEKHVPDILASHPCAKADAIFFLDTIEHLIPILSPETINAILPIVQTYLQPVPDLTLRPHLESAHSVFLAILARGDILHDQILPYIDLVYSAFPQALAPRQVRLAFSTVVKLSPPAQVKIILTNLLKHAQHAQADLFKTVTMGQPSDEQLTYFFAFVDCLPWVEWEEIDFWLTQLAFVTKGMHGRRKDELVRRIWECVSGEMGGEGGLKAVEWWVNGGKMRLIDSKL